MRTRGRSSCPGTAESCALPFSAPGALAVAGALVGRWAPVSFPACCAGAAGFWAAVLVPPGDAAGSTGAALAARVAFGGFWDSLPAVRVVAAADGVVLGAGAAFTLSGA